MNSHAPWTVEYLEEKFAKPDPWRHKTSPYEQTKYKRQIEIIKDRRMMPEKILEIGSAEDGSQASQAPADYQAGFARGLELGMEIATLLSAAPFNSNALELFNQRAAEFNAEVDLVFGNGSDLCDYSRQ